jgi:hypothetical protein
LQADILETSLWINDGEGKFLSVKLPIDIQSAPVYSITAIGQDSEIPYLIFGGNQSRIKPELGSQMGSFGLVLVPDAKNTWKNLLPEQSGLFVAGEIRGILSLKIENKPHLLFLRNNEKPLAFNIN